MTSMWLAFLIGAFVGSFLNVCIHRMPLRQSVVWPASHCPACGGPIAPYDNVPLVSYVLLRGRCRACRVPISFRYPLVEFANGVGYALILWRFGWGWPALIYAALFSALLIVTGIDWAHQIIPDRITLPGIGFGLLAGATVLPVGFPDALLGALVGGGILWLLAWASPYLFGKEGMGGGDIKLLAMIGAFLGWKPALLTIMIGAFSGSIVGVAMILLKLIRRDQYLPFGPFLALGAVIAMFFHQELLAWYQGFLAFDPP